MVNVVDGFDVIEQHECKILEDLNKRMDELDIRNRERTIKEMIIKSYTDWTTNTLISRLYIISNRVARPDLSGLTLNIYHCPFCGEKLNEYKENETLK